MKESRIGGDSKVGIFRQGSQKIRGGKLSVVSIEELGGLLGRSCNENQVICPGRSVLEQHGDNGTARSRQCGL